MKKYLTCAETAKLIRQSLKESFPGVKFSVKSKTYAGGASINVNWTNGPNSKQVNAIVKRFEGSYFDGMSDYKGSNYSSINGEEVSFGADFVFTNRKYTAEFLQSTLEWTAAKYGVVNNMKVIDSQFGAWIEYTGGAKPMIGNMTLDEIAMNIASNYSFDDMAVSPTAASVSSLGDDGYGYNSVGRIAA